MPKRSSNRNHSGGAEHCRPRERGAEIKGIAAPPGGAHRQNKALDELDGGSEHGVPQTALRAAPHDVHLPLHSPHPPLSNAEIKNGKAMRASPFALERHAGLVPKKRKNGPGLRRYGIRAVRRLAGKFLKIFPHPILPQPVAERSRQPQ